MKGAGKLWRVQVVGDVHKKVGRLSFVHPACQDVCPVRPHIEISFEGGMGDKAHKGTGACCFVANGQVGLSGLGFGGKLIIGSGTVDTTRIEDHAIDTPRRKDII